MKIYSSLFAIFLSIILFSCQSETNLGPQIKIYLTGPFAEDSNQVEITNILKLFPRIRIDENGREQNFIFSSVTFVRLDLDNKEEQIIIPNNFANSMKIKAGIELTPADIVNNLGESNENIILPKQLLVQPSLNVTKFEFPSDCIVVKNLDDLKDSLLTQLSFGTLDDNDIISFGITINSNHTVHESIEITERQDEEIKILNTKNEKKKTPPKNNNISTSNKFEKTNSNCVEIKPFNMAISEDLKSLIWNRKNIGLNYEIKITKNGNTLFSLDAINSNSINLSQLNSSKKLVEGSQYFLTITGTCGEFSRSETYDIELQSSTLFNPRCHLNNY
jgi:hypothetical protein